MRSPLLTKAFGLLLLAGLAGPSVAQTTTAPFTSGPIPPCGTSTFTADLTGIGILEPPGTPWAYSLESLVIDITTDHPQTLQIQLTSPSGTTLLLSEFNGAGGQNYTGTVFGYFGYPSITTGSAPFTGWYTAQGGPLSIFDFEVGDGTWTISVTDTACANGGTGPNGTWTPGWFNGSIGGFTLAFSGPPPCWGFIPTDQGFLCPGGSVDLLSYYTLNGGAYDYTFFLNGVQVVDPTNVTVPGTYDVNAYDIWDGCTYWANYTVQPTVAAALGPDQAMDLCTSAVPVDLTALFTLNGSTPFWSLDGSPITPAMAAAASNSGSYQLVASNPGGCNDTVVVTLAVHDAQLGPDQLVDICDGATMDLTTLVNTTGLTMQWTFNGSPIPVPVDAAAEGSYVAVGTSSFGCTDTALVYMFLDAAPALGADLSANVCTNGALDLNTLFDLTWLTADWTYGGAPVADPSAAHTAGLYRVVAANASNCTDTAFVTVSNLTPPALGPDLAFSACTGTTMDLTTNYATAGLSASWYYNGSAAPAPVAADQAGDYALVVVDGSGCQDTASIALTLVSPPALGADQSLTVCDGTTADLASLYNTGANTTAWTLGGSPIADPGAATDAGTYTLVATNSTGCSDTADVTLSHIAPPALGADVVAAICDGSSYDLTSVYGTGGNFVDWTLNGATVNFPGAVDASGNYQLVVTNSSGCADTAVVALTVNAVPSLGPDQSYSLCSWQTLDLSAILPVGGLSATYQLDGAAVADPTAVHDPGVYEVEVSSAQGCTDQATVTVTAMACLCVADFTTDARCMQEPAQFTLLADSVVLGAQWDFGNASLPSSATDPSVRFSTDGDVLVTLDATLSCGVVHVERTLAIQDCADSCHMWVPSAFSPDGDGLNEAWSWEGDCSPEDFSVEVFDRWGELIYTSTDPLKPWTGTYGGRPSPSGVYVYRVGYRLPYQERKEVMGSIALVR